MVFEVNSLSEKNKNPGQPGIDTNRLKEALKAWGEKKETTEDTKKEAEEIVKKLVSSNVPAADMELALSSLPIDKRMQAEQLIIESQRDLIATMSQEKYKQYLQAQFPTGVPANASEMALSMVTDTSEMYNTVKQEIVRTGVDSSDHERGIRRKEQRIATNEMQKSEEATAKLSYELSHIA